jgi:hypothetical protein
MARTGLFEGLARCFGTSSSSSSLLLSSEPYFLFFTTGYGAKSYKLGDIRLRLGGYILTSRGMFPYILGDMTLKPQDVVEGLA